MDQPSEQGIEELREIIRRQREELQALHSVVHDMKVSLGTIAGYAALIPETDETLSNESREYLNRILESAHRMYDDLLVSAGVRTDRVRIEVVQIEPVIRAALGRFQQRLDERGFSVALPDTFPEVMGHSVWITEVFANLIDNAIRYMSADRTDPRITIRSLPQGEMIRFEVEDNGLGIKPEDQEHLNSIFSRLAKEGAKVSRLGYSLSLVARIITRLGGEVAVESTPDQSKTFWFTLPAAKEYNMDELAEKSIEELREVIRRQAVELEAFTRDIHILVYVIRGPLGMIDGFASVLWDSDEKFSEETQTYLNGITHAVSQIQRVIN